MRIFENTSYDFLGKRKKFYILSASFILIGMVTLIFIKGLPLGIDFQGGTELQIRFQRDVVISDLRSSINEAGFSGMVIIDNFTLILRIIKIILFDSHY